MLTMKKDSKALHPDVRIGHVHLKVADLDRAVAFYRDVLGFELTQRYGRQAAFLSAGGYHHHIGLNTWESEGVHPISANLFSCCSDRVMVATSSIVCAIRVSSTKTGTF
jgi:catechol-2,3-dioxygenase